MKEHVLTEKEVLEKKFTASKNGYNPFEVDKFLDLITLSINALNLHISSLESTKKEDDKRIKDLTKQIEDLKNEFQLFKNKFKYLKEDDFIDNRSNLELLKKVNRYEKKLAELGVDINKI